ncbi:MAG: LppX_LprAFG lipoprotein [Chloroflexota bacterium]
MFLLLLLLLLPACNTPPTPTPTPTPDPAAILRQAGEAMQGLQSVHFVITRTGGPAYLDEAQQLLFSAAEGDYAGPDAIQARLTVQGPGLTVVMNTIAVGDRQWVTNPLTQRWEKLPEGFGFNPAVLFDPELGWRPLLNEDVSNLTPVDEVELNGQGALKIGATAAGERVRAITAGIVGDQPVNLEVWLDPTTFYVLQLQFTTATPTGEAADWLLTFSAFNEPVNIEAPET